MKSKLLKTCGLTIVLLLSLRCAQPPGTSRVQSAQTPSEAGEKTSTTAPSNEQSGFSVVRFPWVYTRRGSDGEVYVVTTGKYEVRQSSVASSNEFLFAAVDYADEDGSILYSDDIYAVRFGSDFQVRKADAREWEAAKPLLINQEEIDRPFNTETGVTAGGVLRFGGKSLAKTGETWGSPLGLLSPGSKWLAVFSHTSEKNTRPKFPLFGGGPGPGEIFVDVYDTATGEKVLAGHAPHSGGDPDNSFRHALWIENRYLIVPLDWHAGVEDGPKVGYLIGVLPHK